MLRVPFTMISVTDSSYTKPSIGPKPKTISMRSSTRRFFSSRDLSSHRGSESSRRHAARSSLRARSGLSDAIDAMSSNGIRRATFFLSVSASPARLRPASDPTACALTRSASVMRAPPPRPRRRRTRLRGLRPRETTRSDPGDQPRAFSRRSDASVEGKTPRDAL